MYENEYERILAELGSYLGIQLKSDNNTCQVEYPSGLKLQFELTDNGDLLIAAKLGALFPGHYQNELFKQALKANGAYTITKGAFGFAKKSQMIYLFTFIEPIYQNKEKMAQILDPFIENAKKWFDAVKNNQIPSLDLLPGKSSPSGLFGLRP